jgi:hypothetical protein
VDREPTLSAKDVKQAVAAAKDAPTALCALALDVLSRQGEARLLFAGRDFVDARAKEHGVDEASAKLGGLDVLALLREGPTDARGFATLGALAVRGLDAHTKDTTRLARFVRHADWLELSTPYAPYAFVSELVTDADAVWRAVRDASKALGDAPRDRAIATLHEVTLARAGVAVEKSAAEPADAVEKAAPTELSVEGELRSPPPGGFVGVLRLVFGIALLQWLARGIGLAFGLRRRAVLSFQGGGLRLKKQVTVLGRVVREHDESFTLAAVASAARSARHPALAMLVGACAFSAALVAGGIFLVEGVRSGETFLLIFGGAIVLVGGALDLGLGVLWPATKARRAVELAVLPKRRFALTGVDESSADRFVDELERRLPSR